MDIFDAVQYQDSNVDLTSVYQDAPSPITFPESSVRNRAALTALINPNKETSPVDIYGTMMAEARAGDDFKRSMIAASIDETVRKKDMKSIMDVLADPEIDFEQKKRVVGILKDKPSLSDAGSTLFTDTLAKGVAGENRDQEDARISIAETFQEMYQVRSDIQGLVNAHGASLRAASAGTVAEIAENWVLPFGMNKNTYQLYKASKERDGKPLNWWDRAKAMAFVGSNKKELADKLENLPFDQKVAFARTLVEDIKSNSHIIMNDNQFAQFQNAVELLQEDNYSGFDKFLDNFGPLLDLVGIGQGVRMLKGGKKVAKAIEATPVAVPPKQTIVGAPSPLPESVPAPVIVDVDLTKLKATLKYRNGVPDIDLAKLGVKPATNDPSAYLLGGSGRKVVEEAPQKKVAALLQRVEVNNTVRTENPAAPAKIIQQTNPEMARGLHEATLTAATDEVAEALYGTNKVEAIASDILPQMTNNGNVVTKPFDIGANLRKILDVPERLLHLLYSSGATEFTQAEKNRVLSNVRNDFRSAEGLTVNDSMSSFALDGGRIKVSAVYGAGDGAFTLPEAALAQAKLALRNYAVRDQDIVLLRKEGIEHVPVSYEQVAGVPGNYLIRIETSHEIDVSDVGKMESQAMSWNFLDRIPQLMNKDGGSATRHLFDAASVLPPIYTRPAVAATYRTSALEKVLLEMAGEYGDKWKALTKGQQSRVEDYIREANHNGISLDAPALRARGWSGDEIEAIKVWRRFWDAHYFLENYDLVRTLNAQGYQIFDSAGTTLYAKRLEKNTTIAGTFNPQGTQVVGGQGVYNPATASVTTLTKQEIDDLYNTGGFIAKLRRPTDFNGVTAEIMMVRNTPTEFLRKVRDTDTVLNYRPGYFQIQYNAPKFVDEVLERGNNGEVTKFKTVAVSPDTLTAEVFKSRMSATSGKEYRVRSDDRAFTKDSDGWWDVNSANGRIAQRQRGKLLEAADGVNQLGDGSHVLNPVDSAMRAARSISGRVVTRPVLEAAKARAMQQYAEHFPSNGMGSIRWPRNYSEIGSTGDVVGPGVRDARTAWEYVNYLENGYINGMDNLFKSLLTVTAERLGELSKKFDSKLLAATERGVNNLNEASGGPVSLTKNFVFTAYIGTNVLRQLIVQPHQVVRTFAYNPVGWMKGTVEKYAASYIGKIAGAKLSPEYEQFAKFVDDTGLLSNVDKQNLVRGVLTDAAHSSNRAVRVAGKAVNLPRRIGFDMGEMGNMLGHSAAVYDKFKRAGKNMSDKAVIDEAVGEISAISYGMNFAEDMPYNQTTAALVLQFMQIPHKAFLQVTNRRIDKGTRARLLAGDVLLWGPPTLLISDLMGGDILPDDPENPLRIWALEGLESMLYNEMFNKFWDDTPEDKTRVDFSSLAPFDISGWMKVGAAVMEGGLEQVVLSSPAANLLFKDGSKAERAILSLGRYFNVVDDSDMYPEQAIDVLDNFMHIMSGYSNAAKAVALINAEKRLNDYGNVVENKTEVVERWMQILGFGSADVKDMYALNNEFYKDSKKSKEEAMKMYKDVKRLYYEKLGLPDTDPKMVTALSSHFMKIIKEKPEWAQLIKDELRKDFGGKDQQLLYQIVKAAGISESLTPDKVKRSGLPQKDQEALIKHIEEIKRAREDLAKQEE